MKTKFLTLLFFLAAVANAQTINTIAGTGTAGYNGDGIAATSAELNGPQGCAFDKSGNLYIAGESGANRIRKVTISTGIISTIAGTGTAGYNGDGIAATSAELYGPLSLTFDAVGNIYIPDRYNNRIRKITASTGIISTIAGTGTAGYNGDGIAATSAQLSGPIWIVFDAAGNIFFADYGNHRIRKITISTGIISTVAGTGTGGYNGDGIAATSAELYLPVGIAFDASYNMYIGDYGNHRIRKITAGTGIISTIAGTGVAGYNGDGIAATAAQIKYPNGVTLDAAGNIYIGDAGNNRIRLINHATGIITTIAGTGTAGYNGDGISAATAELWWPISATLDGIGNLYIGDFANQRVRKISGLTILPVNLLSFKGVNEDNYNLLQWQTASEINNDYFTVEKSANGEDFSEVKRVKGAGNSTSVRSYDAIDTAPYHGVSYYRLKQTDYDGKYAYSETIAVEFNGLSQINITAYPNPATDVLTFLTSNSANESVIISVINATGKVIMQENRILNMVTTLNIETLQPGIYFLHLEGNINNWSGKFVKE